MKITTVFICHNEELVQKCLAKYDDTVYIFFVGLSGFIDHPRVIIARNLPDNIEKEPKLLTFTAWYAIIKNNLFTDSDFLCLLEYDVVLDSSFFSELRNACQSNDIVAFKGGTAHWNSNITNSVITTFLVNKKAPHEAGKYWYHTTNLCMRRNILEKFVDWYYPDYLFIKERDNVRLSWYHERVFSAFISSNNYKVKQIGGLKHFQLNSHSIFNNSRPKISIHNIAVRINIPPVNNKCKTEGCTYKIHSRPNNNNGFYCCRSCMNFKHHGALCEKMTFT
jgi:hypothetical protein